MSTVFTDLITYLQAGEAIAANDAIYINSADNKIYKFSATDPTQIFAGIAKEAGVLDEYIRVVQTGRVKGFTGLTPGAFIYASTTVPGGYQEVEPVDSQKVVLGIAKSSTEITINGGLGIKPGGAGGAGGGLDVFYTQNMDGLADASDFSSGNNAAFLGGGSIVGTLGLEEVSPINGTKSLSYTQAVGSADDYVASPEITVGVKQQNNLCAIQGYYTYDGLDDDMRFVVYDATNGAEISSQAEYIKLTGKATRFQIQFYVPETCVSVQWGFQTLAENSGAILLVDDVEMTSDPFTSELTSTEILPYTPSIIGFGTPVGVDFTYQEVGGFLFIKGTFVSGTSTGVEAQIGLPDGYTVLSSEPLKIAGEGYRSVAGAVTYAMLYTGGDSFLNIGLQSSGETGITAKNGDTLMTSGQLFKFSAIVPVNESKRSTSVTAYSARNASNSMIRLNTGNGHGSTNTKIRRFANTVESLGSAITYTDSATDGASFTIEEDGVYFISYTDGQTGTNGLFGLSLNSSELTTNIENLTNIEDRLSELVSVSNSSGSGSWQGYLSKGDIVRPHTNGGSNFTGRTQFTIAKIGTRDLIGIPLPLVGYVKDVKPSGTAGGTFTAGAWQTRDLNTVEGDFSKFGSLSGNQITLQPGEYEIEVNAPAFATNGNQLRLRNIDDGTTEVLGTTALSSSTASVPAVLKGKLMLIESKTFEIQHRCQATRAGDGFGQAYSFGDGEVYTQVKITRLR